MMMLQFPRCLIDMCLILVSQPPFPASSCSILVHQVRKCITFFPTSGPLHMRLPFIWNALFFPVCQSASTHLQSQFRCHFLREAFPEPSTLDLCPHCMLTQQLKAVFFVAFTSFSQPICDYLIKICLFHQMGIPGGSVVKNPPAKSGDLLPESGRSPGEGNSNPLQYSCLDRGSWGGYSPWGHTRVGPDLTTKQQLPLDCKQRFSLLCSLLCLQWPAKQYLMRAQIILSLFARPLKHAFG